MGMMGVWGGGVKSERLHYLFCKFLQGLVVVGGESTHNKLNYQYINLVLKRLFCGANPKHR